MLTAIDNYSIGKQNEVHINEIYYNDFRKYRFICPECGEYVHIVKRTNSVYFAHGDKKKSKNPHCSRRVDVPITTSIYERNGLPMYIRKYIDGYRLCLGFRRLPTQIIEKSVENNVYIQIRGIDTYIHKYFVNFENFSDEYITYIPVNCLPNTNDVKLVYSSPIASKDLSPYWSNFAQKFNHDYGALFRQGVDGGKILRKGENIETYTKYYLLIKNGYILNSFPCIRYQKIATVLLNNVNYHLLEISIEVTVSNVYKFQEVFDFFLKNYNLFLLEKCADVTLLWPPSMKTDDGFITNLNNDLFFNVKTSNTNSKAFIYRDNNAMPFEYKLNKFNNNYVFNLCANSSNFLLSIDRRDAANGVSISTGQINSKEKRNVFSIDTKLIIDDQYRILNCVFQTEVNVIFVSNEYDIKILKCKRMVESIVIHQNLKLLIFVCGEKVIKTLEFEHESKPTLKYTSICEFIEKYKNTKEICIDVNLGEDIDYIISKLPRYRKLFKEFKTKNKVPSGIAKKIRGIKYEKLL